MKEKKGFSINFEPGSKQPIMFYLIAALILSCIFMMITLFTSGFSFTLHGEFPSGDLNNDTAVNASDALHVIMRENKNLELNGAQIDAADVNGDGVINELDATLIIQYASETSDRLGVLAVGNTRLEKPADKNTKNITAETEQKEETPEESFVRTGNSYAAAFCTSESDVYTTARIANKWQADGRYYYQIDVVLKNNSKQYIGDSTFEVDFSEDVTVEKSWKCSAENSDFGLNITTQCYQYIPAGGIIRCGLVVSSPATMEIESVSK